MDKKKRKQIKEKLLEIYDRVFEVNCDLTSYKFSIIKIAVCIGILILMFFRRRLYHVSGFGETVDYIVCGILAIGCYWCFLPSVCELPEIYENRHRNDRRSKNAKLLPMEVIQKIVQENDLVEIEVGENGQKSILIGASAECTRDGDFEEKRFYIQDAEYQTIGEFSEALLARYPKRWVPVSKIDGICVDKTPYGKRAREE